MDPNSVMLVIIVPTLGYLALQSFQQGKQLISLKSDVNILKDNGDKMNQKINLFLKTEIDTLKELVKEAKS